MKAGKLDRRIILQQRTTAQNSFGEIVESWEDYATVWAETETQRVVERFASAQRFATAETVFRVRWYPYLTTIDVKGFRVWYNGRFYNILGIEEIGRKEGAHIVATARTDEGGLP